MVRLYANDEVFFFIYFLIGGIPMVTDLACRVLPITIIIFLTERIVLSYFGPIQTVTILKVINPNLNYWRIRHV
ncbi:MAG: hypothetical protein CR981_03405 [Proteobacteria bacterium]|nr:MAG: hypothetical protein CR981_03405 [Pseudomonadota bacterium]